MPTILITGVCGFVGSSLARAWRRDLPEWRVVGLDNFSRPGSETNRRSLQEIGVRVVAGDLRWRDDVEALPAADWVIDAAANPAVLAGIGPGDSSRAVIDNNLLGTVNLLEYCREHHAGLVFLSSSRVYSIASLAALELDAFEGAYRPAPRAMKSFLTERGITEECPVNPPVSLYGATKLASEILALEYAATFGFPLQINRCGVLAGAGQFGRPDQGIFSFWIHSYRKKQPLTYLGFGGNGFQVRDCLHPDDLAVLIQRQISSWSDRGADVFNVAGGAANSCSLAQLSEWCAERFGPHAIASDDTQRTFDLPWIVLDSSRAERKWNWRPSRKLSDIFEEIALHAERNPDWLELSGSGMK